MSAEVVKNRPMLMSSSSYKQRPWSSGSARSSFQDLSPLPEHVDLTVDEGPSVSHSFDSASIDGENRTYSSLGGEGRGRDQKVSGRPRLRPESKQKSESFLNLTPSRPKSAPPNSAQSPHLRSARYLASQWRSRATQWSASSSMRNFKESSSLPSSPPPPLTEHDSDSDTGSLDDSIASHVSDAYSMLETWKNRVDSMSVNTNDDDSDDGIQSLETLKMSNSRDEESDEYFGPSYAFAMKTNEEIRNKTNKTNASKSLDEITNNMPQIQKKDVTPSDISESSPQTVIPSKTSQTQAPNSMSRVAKTMPTTPTTSNKMLNMAEAKRTKSSISGKTSSSGAGPILPSKNAQPQSPSPSYTSVISVGVSPSRPSTEPIRWEEYEVVFSFSLLTTQEKAPPTGRYLPEEEWTSFRDRLQNRSELLYAVLEKFASTLRRIKSLTNEKGKYMMCPQDCTPVTRFVQRDETYVSQNGKKDSVRSLVRLSVPIFVPRGDKRARSEASVVVKRAFAKAISSGEFSGFS